FEWRRTGCRGGCREAWTGIAGWSPGSPCHLPSLQPGAASWVQMLEHPQKGQFIPRLARGIRIRWKWGIVRRYRPCVHRRSSKLSPWVSNIGRRVDGRAEMRTVRRPAVEAWNYPPSIHSSDDVPGPADGTMTLRLHLHLISDSTGETVT